MMRLQQLQWLCSSIKIKYILAHLTLILNPALPALINITNKCLILNQQVMCSCVYSRNLKFKTFCFVMLQQMVIWKGALTEQSLSPLNSMDYIWAGDDRSSGLQPRWLGFGKLLPFTIFTTPTVEGFQMHHSLVHKLLLCIVNPPNWDFFFLL